MTAHVVTRPYRAPEAILCAGNYSQVSLLLEYMLFRSRSALQSCVTPAKSASTRSIVERDYRQSTFGVLVAYWRSCSSWASPWTSAQATPFCFTAQFLLEGEMVRPYESIIAALASLVHVLSIQTLRAPTPGTSSRKYFQSSVCPLLNHNNSTDGLHPPPSPSH